MATNPDPQSNDQERLAGILSGLTDEDRAIVMDNLRAFFTILREWDDEDRRETARAAHSRQARAARTIDDHFAEGV